MVRADKRKESTDNIQDKVNQTKDWDNADEIKWELTADTK